MNPWLLLAILVLPAFGARAGEPVSDRVLYAFSGEPAVLEMQVVALVSPSPHLAALLASPADWAPPEEGASAIDIAPGRAEYDPAGWMRTLEMGWSGDDGWRIRMAFEDADGRALPTRMAMELRPPAGSGLETYPMGEGRIRYDGPVRVLAYSGIRPGQDGVERMERRIEVDDAGRQRLEHIVGTANDGTASERRREALARNGDGRVVEWLERLDGIDYRVSTRYFDPDARGNPRRVLSVYRLADAAPDAPVQRAELILRTFRYHHETRRRS